MNLLKKSKSFLLILIAFVLVAISGCSNRTTENLSSITSHYISNSQLQQSSEKIASNNSRTFTEAISSMIESNISSGKLSSLVFSSSSSSKAAVFNVKLEAEYAILNGVYISTDLPGYSGNGFATGFDNNNDYITFSVDIPQTQFYDIIIYSTSRIGNGEKNNNLLINDDTSVVASFISYPNSVFMPSEINRNYLKQGENRITISKSWGWIDLDYIIVRESANLIGEKYKYIAPLINPNATESTKRVFQFLIDNYGKKIITGQFSQGKDGAEIEAIKSVTGKYPAIRGFDLARYSLTAQNHNEPDPKSIEAAINWWNEGGIVSYCWHWLAPIDEFKSGYGWWGSFYTSYTYFDLSKAYTDKSSDEYKAIIMDIDIISTQLKRLQDAGTPVLFRPLHESSGGWFWWGAQGKDAQIWLWKFMYDRMTNYHKLNNLIWVWNGQKADWYPGDDYVDIIGEDIYAGDRNYTSQCQKFIQAQNCTTKIKIVALTENASIPDVDLLKRDFANWSFFSTWEGEYVLSGDGHSYSEKSTEISMLKKMYDSVYAITRDELPDFK